MVSIILSIIIVNVLYKLFMKLVGADMMFFSVKGKITAYVVVAVILFMILGI